jgi:soluble lytic murein transglycosylase-like protein
MLIPSPSSAVRTTQKTSLPILCASIFLCFLGFAFVANQARADDFLRTSQYCSRYFDYHERQKAIPKRLLRAVSTHESGRRHAASNMVVPWPWTINAQGKGYYYPDKETAINSVKKFQASGVKIIDVGCMQINLFYHPDAFTSLEEAFDPSTNIAYGAKFLRGLYERNKSWKLAIAQYHSSSSERGQLYASKIFSRWRETGNRSQRLIALNSISSARGSGFLPVENITFSALARFGRVSN